MLELRAEQPAKTILADCAKRGLVIKLDTIDMKRKARHWHLGFEKQPGVLEVTDLGDAVLLKVASNRDGGWAEGLAHDLAKNSRKRR